MRVPRRYPPRVTAPEADTSVTVRKVDVAWARDLLAEGYQPEYVARRTEMPLPMARALAEQAQR